MSRLFNRWTFAAALSCVAVFSAAFAFWSLKRGERVLATILSVEGKATFGDRREIQSNPKSLSSGTRLRVGDELKTEQDAKILLWPIPGIFIEVEGQTGLRIEELRVRKQGNAVVRTIGSRLVVLVLNQGNLLVSLSNFGSGRCELKIKTKAGTFLARRGSLFTMQANDTTVRITCAQGRVSWKNAQGAAAELIPAGYFQTYGSAAETERRVRPASDAARAQSEIASALEFAVSLRSRESSMRDAQSPWRDR